MRSLTQSCLYSLKASKRLSSRQVRLQNHQKLPAYSQTATSSLDKYIWDLERPLFLDYSRFAWFTVKMILIYFIVLRAWAKEDNWTWFIKASLRSLPSCFNGCSRFASGDLNSSHDEEGLHPWPIPIFTPWFIWWCGSVVMVDGLALLQRFSNINSGFSVLPKDTWSLCRL